jgi:YggT family protein
VSALELLRYGVFAVVLASALIGLAGWLVRTRQVNPFGPLGRGLRSVSEPFIRPMEHWVVQRGGNPQNAGWWIVGIALVAGILIVTLANALVNQIAFIGAGGGRSPLWLVVYYAGRLVLLALIVRVIASWFGQFRYSRWMRPVYLLTDWIVEPLKRIIPPVGMFDLSPLVAWFLLQLLLGWLTRIL